MFILPLVYEKCTETNCIFSIKESDVLQEKNNQKCEKPKFTVLSLLNKTVWHTKLLLTQWIVTVNKMEENQGNLQRK